MDNQSHKFSAFFKLYDTENLQVSFNLVENDLESHLNNLDSLIELLKNKGFSVDPKSLEDGERIQEVTGWVLGRTSKDEDCVHLYGPDFLQWKIVTVWQEDINKLGITFPRNLDPVDVAPEREVAVKRKLLQPFPQGTRVILEPVRNHDGSIRENDKGNPILRFSRMHGQPKSQPQPDSPSPPAQNGTSLKDDVQFQKNGTNPEEIDTYPDGIKLLEKDSKAEKFALWCRTTQEKNKRVASKQNFDYLCELIDSLVNSPGSAQPILCVLSGLDIPDLQDQISNYLVSKLTEWLDEGTEETPQQGYNERYAIAVTEIFTALKKLWVDA